MNAMEQGVALHDTPRQPGELDLIAEVRGLLLANGLGAKIAAFDGNEFIALAVDKTTLVQRHYLNRYWGSQLMSCPKSSIDERFCLLPNGEPAMWLTMFTQKVLPFIIENGLPVPIATR